MIDMADDLDDYYNDQKIYTRYLSSCVWQLSSEQVINVVYRAMGRRVRLKTRVSTRSVFQHLQQSWVYLPQLKHLLH